MERFQGLLDVYLVDALDLLEVYFTTIKTTCGTEYPGNTHLTFEVVSITSKYGGTVCCAPVNIDSTKPVISNCPTNKSVNLPPSSCTTTVSWTPPTSTDNCSVSLTSTHQPNLTPFTTGQTVVTYTATDTYGNQSTCKFTVTVFDVTAPEIAGCPIEIKAIADESCQATVPPPALILTDNCGTPILSSDHPSNIFSLGAKLVKYTATDLSGNKATCIVKVTVEDKTPPVFVSRPPDIVATANDNCKAKVTWDDAKATDNCSGAQLKSDYDKGFEFSLGKTIVTYTAVDAAGNSDTISFRVIVSNPADPAIEGCPGTVTVNATPNGDSTTVIWVEPIATVKCGVVKVERSHAPGSKFPVGISPVTYTFTDSTGRSSTCEFNVQVLQPDAEVFAISKVVTPDGDGINDVWKLSNIENFQSNTVVVVDRWGNKIFQATGYDNTRTVWNGTNSSGTIVPTGTYFYTIEIRDQGKVVLRKGFIEVIQ